ncbi:MAG: hypothetical protein JW910_02645 [Anaerolineae bacterium]|nr:hypothetical protein [Anaerolineae bacterium]
MMGDGDTREGQQYRQTGDEPPEQRAPREAEDDVQQSDILDTVPDLLLEAEAGELADVVQDSTQEIDDDRTAQSEDQAFARQAPELERSREPEVDPARVLMSRAPAPSAYSHDRSLHDSEESGEAGDVVQDSTQETSEDQGAEVAEDRAQRQETPREGPEKPVA